MRISSAGNLCGMVLFVPNVLFCMAGTLGSGGAKHPSVHTPVRPSVILRISEADTDSGDA